MRQILACLCTVALLGCSRPSIVGKWQNQVALSDQGVSGSARVNWEFRADGSTVQRSEITISSAQSSSLTTTVLEGNYTLQGTTLDVKLKRATLDGPLTGHKDLLAPLPPSLQNIGGTFQLDGDKLTVETRQGRKMTFTRVGR
jgi:hypothetical protein